MRPLDVNVISDLIQSYSQAYCDCMTRDDTLSIEILRMQKAHVLNFAGLLMEQLTELDHQISMIGDKGLDELIKEPEVTAENLAHVAKLMDVEWAASAVPALAFVIETDRTCRRLGRHEATEYLVDEILLSRLKQWDKKQKLGDK